MTKERIIMKTITVYRPTKTKKFKSLLLVALLLVMAFLAGAVTEKSAHFLQDVIAAAPVVLDEVKAFLRERIIFKVDKAVEQVKWAAVIIISIITQAGSGSHVIRGP